jgi:adenylate cyclase
MSTLKEYLLNKWAPDYDVLQERSNRLEIYERFFPKFLDRQILQHKLDKLFSTDGEIKQICVMFTDLRGFTKYSEKASLLSTNNLLNNFYDIVIHHTQENSGIVDKFMGDGTMSIFGMFNPRPQSMARAAARAAMGIMQDFKGMTSQIHEPNLRLGIGLSQGPSLVGNFGNGELVTFTAIGTTVNLAARVQGQAEDNNILATKEVIGHLPDKNHTSKGYFELKNVSKKLELFELQY